MCIAAPFDEAAYVESYKQEIAYFARQTPGRTVQSIFFGGGTPSLMDPRSVGAILETIGHYWNIAPKAEITLEANPTSVEADRFRGYRAAGVNRVSLGVQSLRPGPLPNWAVAIRSTKRSPRCASRNRSSRAQASTSSMRGPNNR